MRRGHGARRGGGSHMALRCGPGRTTQPAGSIIPAERLRFPFDITGWLTILRGLEKVRLSGH
ncbi:hypothetical protein CLV41_101684 [Roseibium marinum]|uniref:Uncharacterized protein n=1 Tax=Roseibium marinum TaxID=281252 RepID=A0A2S3V2M7_9HYPH|nr:hypothetical protein CLV41_101684 [Roseibium marinum]